MILKKQNSFRTCDADRQWSGGEPECKEINCGRPNNGLFPNGWFEVGRTNLNAVVTFRYDITLDSLYKFLKLYEVMDNLCLTLI